jgi:uncharacterized protein (TIGR02117 family)
MIKIVKILLSILLTLLIFLVFYFLCVFVGSNLINSRVKTKEKKNFKVLILSNGVHTDIVLPVKNKIIDWRNTFPVSNTRAKYNHEAWIAFGWGDKGFYLNTPTWGDLTFSTAFKASTGLSSTALHVTYRDSIKIDSSNCIPLHLTKKEFISLKKFIIQSVKKNKNKKSIFIPTDAVYGDNDAFYESTGTYHLFYTCNTWTNEALKSCNQKSCFWTPFESGIFDLYKP